MSGAGQVRIRTLDLDACQHVVVASFDLSDLGDIEIDTPQGVVTISMRSPYTVSRGEVQDRRVNVSARDCATMLVGSIGSNAIYVELPDGAGR